MKYVALLRGINAGKNRRVAMNQLKAVFERLGCTGVSTYINSGNVVFEATKSRTTIHREVEATLRD